MWRGGGRAGREKGEAEGLGRKRDWPYYQSEPSNTFQHFQTVTAQKMSVQKRYQEKGERYAGHTQVTEALTGDLFHGRVPPDGQGANHTMQDGF